MWVENYAFREREKKNNSNPPQGQGWHYSVFFLILNKSQESPTLPVSVVLTPVMPIEDVLGQQQSSMAQRNTIYQSVDTHTHTQYFFIRLFINLSFNLNLNLRSY